MLKILFLCGRELEYTRNSVLFRAFQRFAEVEVLGKTITNPSITARSIKVLFQALPHLRRPYDLIFVGFYGHLLMLPIGTLAHSPILFDAFISTYDTLCFDRRKTTPTSLLGRLAFWLDQTACRKSRHTLLDTPLHIKYFQDTFQLPADHFSALPVGCNEDIFYPRPPTTGNNITRVLYYTTYLPLHGIDVVIRAAAKLQSVSQLQFILLGAGPEYPAAYRLAKQLSIRNVDFFPMVPLTELPVHISNADIVLGGHFGASAKASRVIPGKIYQILAMGRPLLAADTPANRALLIDDISAKLCPPADPDALASTIQSLLHNPEQRQQLAALGRELYLEQCSEAVIAHKLRAVLDLMI